MVLLSVPLGVRFCLPFQITSAASDSEATGFSGQPCSGTATAWSVLGWGMDKESPQTVTPLTPSVLTESSTFFINTFKFVTLVLFWSLVMVVSGTFVQFCSSFVRRFADFLQFATAGNLASCFVFAVFWGLVIFKRPTN